MVGNLLIHIINTITHTIVHITSHVHTYHHAHTHTVTLDSGKSTATLPAIYQLLQADPTSTARQTPHSSVSVPNESTSETSTSTTVTAVSRGIPTDPSSDLLVSPSSVIVQTKTKVHEWQPASAIKDSAYMEVESSVVLDKELDSEAEKDKEQNGTSTVDKAQYSDGVATPPTSGHHSKNKEEVEEADVPAPSPELSTDSNDSNDTDIIKLRKLS